MNNKITIAEIARRNYENQFTKSMTAYEMAMSSHNLDPTGTYARLNSGPGPSNSLWVWSDRREVWVQIDFQSVP